MHKLNSIELLTANLLNDFLVEYNELLSQAALEHKGKFSALASPTLNKQETVTFLYRDVVNQIKNHSSKEEIFIKIT